MSAEQFLNQKILELRAQRAAAEDTVFKTAQEAMKLQKQFEEQTERALYAERRAREIANHLVFQLRQNGCGCESITDGGWTCPAHEALKSPETRQDAKVKTFTQSCTLPLTHNGPCEFGEHPQQADLIGAPIKIDSSNSQSSEPVTGAADTPVTQQDWQQAACENIQAALDQGKQSEPELEPKGRVISSERELFLFAEAVLGCLPSYGDLRNGKDLRQWAMEILTERGTCGVDRG